MVLTIKDKLLRIYQYFDNEDAIFIIIPINEVSDVPFFSFFPLLASNLFVVSVLSRKRMIEKVSD